MASAIGQPRILVVESDPAISDLLRTILQERGWQTVAASDGEQALSQATANHPDLAILDFVLPKMTGVEVCRRLSADLSIPVIMLGERGYTFARLSSVRAGAKSYIGKPFQVTELIAGVEAVLSRKG